MKHAEKKFDLKKIRKNIEELIEVAEPLRKKEIESSNVDSRIRIGKLSDFEDNDREEINKFFDKLQTFSQDELVEILSVMYAGRDYVLYGSEERFIPLLEQFDSLYQDREGIECTLIEKFELINYLNAGMRYYSI